jgi:alanine racemase
MVKANAYGHDAIFTAKSLIREKNLQGFGVATFSEAVSLREGLKDSSVPILVFSDSCPWDDLRTSLCLKYKLDPVLSELSSLLDFQNDFRTRKLNAHIEVNTGMNRLGIPLDALSRIRFLPTSVFTHLAHADEPTCKLTQLQMKNFAKVIDETRVRFPRALLHFSNSSAIWNAKEFLLTQSMNIVRPGLSLYGIRPFAEAKDDGLKRVMRFLAPIINRIHLKKGDQVGYGGTYTCKKSEGEWVSILGAGYADGLFRSLSSRGFAMHKKQKLGLLGRVSMDLSAAEGGKNLKIGDALELWGDSVDPYLQAALAQTIPYEITTRIGQRVEKHYE